MNTPRPATPTLRTRVAAGLAGGTAALAVTVSLALAQAGAGGAAVDTHPRATDGHSGRSGSHAGIDAVAAVASPSHAAATPRRTAVDPQGTQGEHRPVTSAAPASALAAGGIPATALAAYRYGARPQSRTSCRLPWALLAGIGRVESDHGRFAGAVLHTDGVSTPAIIGIPLDGNGTEVVRDTDGGRLDGDTVYDRAVGPMQFIPSTWATWGRDGNGDGVRDPFNIYDAAAAAADYLCAAGGDLGTAAGQRAAVLAYNHSTAYLAEVTGLEKLYAAQFGVAIPDLPTLRVPAAHRSSTHPSSTHPAASSSGAPRSGAGPSSPTPTPTRPASGRPSAPGASSGGASSGGASSGGTSSGSSPSHSPTASPTCRPTSSPTPSPTASANASHDPAAAAGAAASPAPAAATPTSPSPSPTPTCPK